MKRPLLILALTAVCAVVFCRTFNSVIAAAAVAAGICIAILLCLHKKARVYIVGLIVVVAVGFAWYADTLLQRPAPLKAYEETTVNMYIQVLSPPVERADRLSFTAVVKAVDDGSGLVAAGDARIQLTLYGDGPVLKAGDQLRVRGKIKEPPRAQQKGAFDYNLYLRSKRIYSVANVSASSVVYAGEGDLPFFMDDIYRLRTSAQEAFSRYASEEATQLIGGILWGDKSLEGELKENITASGAAHIFAVSGLHIWFLYGLIDVIFRKLRVKEPYATICVLLILLLYGAMASFTPSVVRALIMLAVLRVAKLTRRVYDPLSALCFASLIVMMFNPLMIFTASFQLSFVAVLGIIFFANVVQRKIALPFRPLRRIIQMMALSFCIQLALLPVLTHHFSTVSLIAIFSNVILIPLASLILYSSVIGLAVSLFPPVATLYFYILEWEVSLLNMVAKLFAQTPYATIVLPKMNVAEAALYYIVLFAIFGYYNLKKRTTRMTLVVGVAICILASAAIRLSGVSF